jgi:hypothetical protein
MKIECKPKYKSKCKTENKNDMQDNSKTRIMYFANLKG